MSYMSLKSFVGGIFSLIVGMKAIKAKVMVAMLAILSARTLLS